jgi:hypothetical protein
MIVFPVKGVELRAFCLISMWTWAIPSVPISFLVCFSDWVPC